jgi:hypothetical protein
MDHLCSTQFAQIMLEGMEEVIGKNDLQAFFQKSQYPQARLRGESESGNYLLSYHDLCEFQSAMEASFGVYGGRGVLLRSGRASFRHLLPAFWENLGMTNLKFRLNPTPVRIRLGLRALAKSLSHLYNQEIEVIDEGESWVWRMTACPFCCERETSGPVCDFAVGLLQEFLSWTSSGRFYMVEEFTCLGAGSDACSFRIWKKPLD